MLLDGIKVRDEILNNLQKEVKDNNYDITFAILLIGNNPESEIYVHNKIKYAEKVGIKTKFIHLNEATTEEVIDIINKLNDNSGISGIILQSPTPGNIDFEKCISKIDPKKDIDGFTKENVYKLINNIDGLRPCTPEGIKELLKHYNVPLKGANVCIIGSGKLVGRPLIFAMINEGATITSCNSKTKDLKKHTENADIIICGVGKKHILTADMVKEGAVVVDAGITVEDGKIIGDADFDDLKDKCSYITPNPGGVGPMTIAILLSNVVKAYKNK